MFLDDEKAEETDDLFAVCYPVTVVFVRLKLAVLTAAWLSMEIDLFFTWPDDYCC